MVERSELETARLPSEASVARGSRLLVPAMELREKGVELAPRAPEVLRLVLKLGAGWCLRMEEEG